MLPVIKTRLTNLAQRLSGESGQSSLIVVALIVFLLYLLVTNQKLIVQ